MIVSDIRTNITYKNISIFECNNVFTTVDHSKYLKKWYVLLDRTTEGPYNFDDEDEMVSAIEDGKDIDSAKWTIKSFPGKETPHRFCSFGTLASCNPPSGCNRFFQFQEIMPLEKLNKICLDVSNRKKNTTFANLNNQNPKEKKNVNFSSVGNVEDTYTCMVFTRLWLKRTDGDRARQRFAFLVRITEDEGIIIERSKVLHRISEKRWRLKVCSSKNCRQKSCFGDGESTFHCSDKITSTYDEKINKMPGAKSKSNTSKTLDKVPNKAAALKDELNIIFYSMIFFEANRKHLRIRLE